MPKPPHPLCATSEKLMSCSLIELIEKARLSKGYAHHFIISIKNARILLILFA
jgi:hypothetical protein